MKIIDIALKDLLRSFRSMFLLIMMIVAPLLLTGLIYFAFGNSGGGGFSLPLTRVVVANLDRPDQHSGLAAGKLLAGHLAAPEMSSIMAARNVSDEASAIRAVDGKQADAAIIIPAGFTAAVVGEGGTATIRLYHDPTMSIGPSIVKTVVSEFIDGFSGATIAVQVANRQLTTAGLVAGDRVGQTITGKYVEWVQSSRSSTGQGEGTSGSQILAVRSPSREAAQSQAGSQADMIPLIMASMLIFFVFFTGAASASTIVWEDEEGTLARLFTTPTSQTTILGGKLLGSVLTIVAQALVLIFASALLFNISWGNPATLAVLLVALVVAAAGFGVFLMSFVKNSRQAGPIQGVVVTLTGMLGGLFTSFTALSVALDNVSLVVPQGWAMRGMKLALAGASPMEVVGPTVVLLAIGVVLFVVGTVLFRRRFA